MNTPTTTLLLSEVPHRTGERTATLTAQTLAGLEDRFWARVDQSAGPSECWPWTGNRDPAGYGQMSIRGRQHRTHRIAYVLTVGPIPAGREICHRCDNKPCANPAHLFAATHRENILDARDKGRLNSPRGERSARAVLTTAKVREIRSRAARGESERALGRAFGVSQVAIHFVLTRRTWAHVDAEPEAVSA